MVQNLRERYCTEIGINYTYNRQNSRWLYEDSDEKRSILYKCEPSSKS